MLKCKRIFSAAIAAFLCFSLTACGAQNASSDTAETASSDTISTSESTFASAETETAETAVSADNESTTQEYDMNRTDFHLSEFGENVYIFSPDDDPADIQKVLNSLWIKQETNQFGDNRYALYFLPGEYSEEISVKVGYYMQVAGLGATPDDTTLHNVNCDARWLGDENNHNATCNFWRGVENLQVTENVMWAVSQATFMRNMHIQGVLRLHDENGWSSGGFLSNSKIDMLTDSGSQQQWLSRNCDWKAWMGQNWNMVFAGIAEGKAPAGTWPGTKYTTLETVEKVREKPFLAYDKEQGFGVYVPETKTDSLSYAWEPGTFVPISDFYIAKSDTDDASSINAALAAGKHIFLTPGVYELEDTLVVENPDTIFLGAGLATLRSMKGNACMKIVGDIPVTIAGILFDAGPEATECLFVLGEEAESAEVSDSAEAADPAETSDSAEATDPSDKYTLLADLFFRVGGAKTYNTNVSLCALINQDNVVGDNFWVWRADHGSGVSWTQNKAKNGIRVTGDNVTIYALMVEHFQEYQTIWEGENGKVIFYQCEIPYDVPNQKEWISNDGTVNGFASYKIGDNVDSHEAWGLGIYLYNRDAIVELHHAMEVPEDAENIFIHNICTVMITGNPGISHIINDEGGHVYNAGEREVIVEYPGED